MPITLVSATGTAQNAGGSFTMTTTASIQDGDILVASIGSNDNTGADGGPAGWALVGTANPAGGRSNQMWWKRAASESGNYVFTTTGAPSRWVGDIACYRGCLASGSPIDVGLGSGYGAAGTCAISSVTTVTAGAMLVAFYSQNAANAFSTPTGMTMVTTAAGDIFTSESYYQLIAAAGATGTRTTTAGAAAVAGTMFALTPAAVAPSAPTLDTVTGGNRQLSAAFTAGGNGGSAITTYKYSTDNGASYLTRQDGGTTASPIVITNLSSSGTTRLSPGVLYQVLIKAVNAIGDGTASNAITASTAWVGQGPTVPSIPSLGR